MDEFPRSIPTRVAVVWFGTGVADDMHSSGLLSLVHVRKSNQTILKGASRDFTDGCTEELVNADPLDHVNAGALREVTIAIRDRSFNHAPRIGATSLHCMEDLEDLIRDFNSVDRPL